MVLKALLQYHKQFMANLMVGRDSCFERTRPKYIPFQQYGVIIITAFEKATVNTAWVKKIKDLKIEEAIDVSDIKQNP